MNLILRDFLQNGREVLDNGAMWGKVGKSGNKFLNIPHGD